MFTQHEHEQHRRYHQAFQYLLKHHELLIEIEKYIAAQVNAGLQDHIAEITSDYNEASFLYPFWRNYPPDERGNHPRGDQFPWIEVGEHVLSAKLPVILRKRGFEVRDCGLPTGADLRFVLTSEGINKASGGLTSTAWLHADVKSVGPRDDFDHTVMSHNQVSGSGDWPVPDSGIKNTVMRAIGPRSAHDFHCALPPIYVLSDGTIAPTVLMVIKPVYRMLSLESTGKVGGQPLGRIDIAAIPNGILLEHRPAYLRHYRGLIFPGKDDKGKNPLKVRARVSFPILRTIAEWRLRTITPTCP